MIADMSCPSCWKSLCCAGNCPRINSMAKLQADTSAAGPKVNLRLNFAPLKRPSLRPDRCCSICTTNTCRPLRLRLMAELPAAVVAEPGSNASRSRNSDDLDGGYCPCNNFFFDASNHNLKGLAL
uniref:(northern house mosquito) hypothetical protein n=1 Tax=Culex pipiens TaxID=7175 RepID=A0A8D8L1C5_CULPI